MAGQRFSDVTADTTLSGSGFGQGCSAGDFNNDGFPDLYVGNVGTNRLYQNMGDGTFADVSDNASLADDSWTVSTMVCDLNADSLPDLFDVNYLTGEDVYKKICRNRSCSPSVFPGAPDHVLINLGDGRFVQVDDATPENDSKGLGVVAFESNPDRRPTLFIANDQVANYLLLNRPANNRHNIEFRNDAVVSGLAFNDHGLPMACMGVAVDDLDGNNLLDLFVTNFQDESNNVYLQDSPGLYTDATRSLGLQAASVPYTGWGTQALDADLDGRPDLVVANGHVDDGREYGGDYHQRPQFFHNLGGQFKELRADTVGSWFAGRYLGRGLARVDWNLDGLPDFVVSNINSPVSVLTNATSGTGHFFRILLHATQTARDAIGTRVTVQFDDRQVTRQLLAGDGYMATNERVVEFGLGNSSAIRHVDVQWPSGAKTTIESPHVDTMMIVVEGLNRATQIEQSEPTGRSVTTTKAAP